MENSWTRSDYSSFIGKRSSIFDVAHKTTVALLPMSAFNDRRRLFETIERLITWVSNLRTDSYTQRVRNQSSADFSILKTDLQRSEDRYG